MRINKLTIQNFKNHENLHLDLSAQINCFVGNNGVGKTNILDALHYLSVGKSFLGNTDLNNIQRDKEFFTIEGEIQNDEKEDILKISISTETKKTVKKNDKSYDRLSDHIGYLPSVIISPYDQNLISDSGESRRKFLDAMISQTDSAYLFSLIQFQKTLQQRNALLKSFAKNRYFDVDNLEIYNEPLTQHGEIIFEKRKAFVTKLNPVMQDFYHQISGGKEEINIIYQSDLEENYTELLLKSLDKDRILTHTSKGIHKDDLVFEMMNYPIKKVGSQGQQKTFLVALKLAQISRIKSLTNKTPILLLDDIFDKLDDRRVAQLIDLVNQENFGQLFITDTHKDRTEVIIKNINKSSKIYEV